jgi:hypothetical protein
MRIQNSKTLQRIASLLPDEHDAFRDSPGLLRKTVPCAARFGFASTEKRY